MAIKHEKLAQFFHYHTIGFHLFPTHQNHLEVLKTEEKKKTNVQKMNSEILIK